MKQSFCRRFKKSVSAVLAAAMSLSVFTSIPVSAENGSVSAIGKTTYTYNDYYVEYYVTDAWSGSQNVELTVYNTGEESILNWALKYDAQGEVSNLWNAGIYEQNDSEYVIRNVDWNFEIAPNQCVMYGYRLTGNDLSLPESFELYSKRVDVTENYDVTYNITNEWDTGVQGEIVITNHAAAPLEAWTLSFDSNFAVIDLWNGRVLENNGTSYTIAAEVWTNPVQPNSSMTIGFTGTKESGVEAVLSNFRLTQVVIGESNGTATPVDPPVDDEKIEITANAAYDEDNGDVTVSWDSNKQEGMFDILISTDGENFASVGTVTGASEYVYTPDNDFETLYFKVVQTVGEQSAESNVVSVTNTNSSEDIDITISANGVYDEESGDITISWETNTDNGFFEIFMSEDGEEFVSIGNVEGVSEYVYTPATDFEEIYFKVIQTAGNKSAESNVVTVNNSIVLSVITSANYDEESGNIKVSWITSFNKGTYEVFVSDDDENFISLGIVENAKEYIYTPEGEFAVLYFKVKQTVGELTAESKSAAAYYPIDWSDRTDTDNDGLADVYEKYYLETDPTNPDTDGDGLLDGYEVYYLGTDPKKADSDDNGIADGDEDFDNDGLSNLREYELGTDPHSEDTDSDGLTDSEEVDIYNTDPLKYDTDDDGISDGDEIALGLNPTNASTDGTPDSERTFMQHVGADSENFAAINTTENPFEVSIDITAAGVAANNLYSHESGYSNAIKNDAILGITPEFTYTDGLKVEDVIINFTIDKSAEMNYNNKYTDISDEFVGIKRLNVFKFFEDINMLLPIETFHDVENNRVYTHTDELGTYCLMDMEIWLESLGITAEGLVDNTDTAVFSARSMPVAYSDDDTEEGEQEEQEYLDVVLVAYPSIALIDETKAELKITSEEIFKRAAKENLDARIYFVNFLGDSIKTTDGKLYAETYEEAVSIINRQPAINGHSEASYALHKALNYIRDNIMSQFRDDSKRFCFLIDVGGYPTTDVGIGAVSTLKENGVVIGFSYNRGNPNIDKYILLATNAICEQAVPGGGRYNFGDFIVNEIFSNHENEYPIVSAVGWKRINLNEPITPVYKSVATSIENDEMLREQVIALNKYADTDNDELLDLEEIMFHTEEGKDLITFEKNGDVILPKFEDCTGTLPWNRRIFYVKNGLKRYADIAKFQDLFNLRILPIKSDPTSVDGDEDSVSDFEEYLLLGKNPLVLDNVRVMNNKKYSTDADVINHLKEVYKVAGSEKLVKYMMEDYYDTASKIDVSTISDSDWMRYCTQLNEYVKDAYTFKIMPADVHYFRNNLNRAPSKFEDLVKQDNWDKSWILLPVGESVFHMFGDYGVFNVKFVSSDINQIYEAVYDVDGNLLTYENDPHSCSTYNYCGPSDVFSHTMLDVIPYYLYYSVPEIENPYEDTFINLGIDLLLLACDKRCVLLFVDEIWDFAAGENRIKYYTNSVAQNYRQNQVLKLLYTDCIKNKNEHKFAKGERPDDNKKA